MATTRHSTKTAGVRYKLHPSRRHGVNFDKYFSIRYRVDGKPKEEGLGWSTEGWSEKKAGLILAELKGNITTAIGPRTLAEKRKIEDDRREDIERQEQKTAEKEAREKKIIFDNIFLQYCETNTHKKSLKDEISYFKNWISPAIGKKRLDQIILFDLERIRASMTKAGKAARSIQYIKSIVRQIFRYAAKHDIYSGKMPTVHFLEKQKIDNKRQRYLTPEEATTLLDDIKKHSLTTYRISLLSLNSGMRFGEIAGLLWQHINITTEKNKETGEPTTTGEILIIDPKNSETRTAHMTKTIIKMFQEMQTGTPDSLIFPAKTKKKTTAKDEKKMVRISNVFQESVNRLGFNTGVTDRRLKLCFHSLRHSCASTLANSGVEIPVIAKILGHKTLQMTMRYSHINDKSVKDAMMVFDQEQTVETGKKSVKIQSNS